MLFNQTYSAFNRKKFVKFKDSYAGNRANTTLPLARETWETFSGYEQSPTVFVSWKNDNFVLARGLAMSKNINFLLLLFIGQSRLGRLVRHC